MAKKKISRKVPPVREDVAQAYNDFTASNEETQSELKAIGEVLSLHGEKLDRLEQLEQKVDRQGEDIDLIKIEVRLIRRDQVSRQEFELLEDRVAKLEKSIQR